MPVTPDPTTPTTSLADTEMITRFSTGDHFETSRARGWGKNAASQKEIDRALAANHHVHVVGPGSKVCHETPPCEGFTAPA